MRIASNLPAFSVLTASCFLSGPICLVNVFQNSSSLSAGIFSFMVASKSRTARSKSPLSTASRNPRAVSSLFFPASSAVEASRGTRKARIGVASIDSPHDLGLVGGVRQSTRLFQALVQDKGPDARPEEHCHQADKAPQHRDTEEDCQGTHETSCRPQPGCLSVCVVPDSLTGQRPGRADAQPEVPPDLAQHVAKHGEEQEDPADEHTDAIEPREGVRQQQCQVNVAKECHQHCHGEEPGWTKR